jgi:flagellar FliJ protein
MRKFDFRLKTVLKVREQEELSKRRALTEEEIVLEEAKAKVEQLREETSEVEGELRDQQVSGSRAQDLAAHLAYLHSLQEQSIQSQDRLMLQQNITESKRRDVADAQKRKKMIENLKDKRYLQWKHENEIEENKLLDEIAMQQFTRRDGES